MSPSCPPSLHHPAQPTSPFLWEPLLPSEMPHHPGSPPSPRTCPVSLLCRLLPLDSPRQRAQDPGLGPLPPPSAPLLGSLHHVSNHLLQLQTLHLCPLLNPSLSSRIMNPKAHRPLCSRSQSQTPACLPIPHLHWSSPSQKTAVVAQARTKGSS